MIIINYNYHPQSRFIGFISFQIAKPYWETSKCIALTNKENNTGFLVGVYLKSDYPKPINLPVKSSLKQIWDYGKLKGENSNLR